MKKDRIIRVRLRSTNVWLYVGPQGVMTKDKAKAETLTSDQAGKRLLQYTNDYPDRTFEEVPGPIEQDPEVEETRHLHPRTRTAATEEKKE